MKCNFDIKSLIKKIRNFHCLIRNIYCFEFLIDMKCGIGGECGKTSNIKFLLIFEFSEKNFEHNILNSVVQFCVESDITNAIKALVIIVGRQQLRYPLDRMLYVR